MPETKPKPDPLSDATMKSLNSDRKTNNMNNNDLAYFALSPTDNILSPCSKKLIEHKNRFITSLKPTKLNFSDI
ncbi:hypothetical protein WICPIJ_003685 [Wickerhamomyces pijperi]|uniref:Uncharacterized protein n=1 Tax=Wickerhamomyces pijperi TaxID=599730 RepID=A0A9P8Q750_WICPI|nr:hypothetical protein WICPIJ_003685 [Wickerhamomyces pijperi]